MGELIGDLPHIVASRPDLYEREVLAATRAGDPLLPAPENTAFYETYGRLQLAKRGGGQLITHALHVRPLVAALERREESALDAATGSGLEAALS